MTSITIPPTHRLERSTLGELSNQRLAAWLAEYNSTCCCCQTPGPHQRIYVTVVESGPIPDPRVICATCDELLWSLSQATPTALAVRWFVERRQPGLGQSLETLIAAGLRLGRREQLYTCTPEGWAHHTIVRLAQDYSSANAVPHDLRMPGSEP